MQVNSFGREPSSQRRRTRLKPMRKEIHLICCPAPFTDVGVLTRDYTGITRVTSGLRWKMSVCYQLMIFWRHTPASCQFKKGKCFLRPTPLCPWWAGKKKSQPPPGLLGLSLITKVKQKKNGKGSAVRSSRARWRDGGRISTKSKWEAIDSCCCVLCVKKSRFICIFHHRSRPTLASANLCAGRGRPMASISVWTHNPCIAPSEKKNV